MKSRVRDYSPYRGWYFQREETQVEIFRLHQCDYCKGYFSDSHTALIEASEEALLSGGLRPANAPAVRGGLHFSGGPALCATCVKAWRLGKIDV